jgi:heat shock protein HtpX
VQEGRQQVSNIFKTAILLAVLTAMLVFIGGAIGGQQGMLVAFVLALAMNVGSYWFSHRIVLAMYRAQPIEESQAPALHALVRRLATQARIPMPRLYLIPTETPNAFATGRNPEHAVVAVTEGILRMLDQDELEGVLAHELAHVKNRDVLISTIAATLAGAVTYLAHMAQWAAIFGHRSDDEEHGVSPVAAMAMAVVAPLAAMLVQLAVSRAREFQADATGARLAGRTWGLA